MAFSYKNIPASGVLLVDIQKRGKVNPIWYRYLSQAFNNLSGFLVAANNLSDVGNSSTAITNLFTGHLLVGTYGGTGVNNGAKTITLGGNLTTSGAFNSTFTMTNTTSVTFPVSGTLATTSQLPVAAALTSNNDTNVTLTLGGTPSTALLQSASITAGWTGTLSAARGGIGRDSSSDAQGDLPYISATGVWNHLAKNTTATRYVANTGTSNNPNWDQVNLTNGVTGTLPVANGGTGVSAIPACSAYDSGGTTLTAGAVTTKINLATEVFDTNSNFASSRFTPTVAGKYLIVAQLALSSVNVTTTNQYFVEIYKNGTLYSIGSEAAALSQFVCNTGTNIIDMNGSTDYIEMYGYNGNAATTVATLTGQAYTFFSAVWVCP